MKSNILSFVKQKEEKIIKIRRDLHQIPELQLSLPKTVKYICEKLEELHIPYHKLVNGNAIVALIKGSEEGKFFIKT